MAIDFDRNIISSGYNLAKVNDNFAKIEEALVDGLSRTGEGPNQMEADIDLNSNDLLNVSLLDVQNINYQGETLAPSELVVTGAMLKSQYDPTNVAGDVFDRNNHSGDIVVFQVGTRVNLKAVDTTKKTSVFLKEAGREGVFKWTTGNFVTQIAADTLEGLYIKADAIAATVGAWVRQGDWSITGVSPLWFGADATGVADSGAAIRAAVAMGYAIVFPRGTFVSTLSIPLLDGQHVRGLGGGYMFDTHTKIVFSGTGLKEHAIAGATATVIANPSAGEAYLADSGTRGNNYTTLDLTSNFSAGIILGKGSKVENLGVYPLIGGSLAAYSNDASNAISDDWDVGIWARNADAWRLENVIVAGHWRKYAFLTSSHDIGDGKVPSNEKGRAVNCHFQGFRGVGIRTPETVVGSNYGFAGTIFDSCDFRPLQHQSAHLATSSFLATPFTSPAGCLEVAGDSGHIRGFKFYNVTLIGRDDICIIATAGSEMMFSGGYLEAQNIKISGAWATDKEGSRMVGNSNASAWLFDELSAKFAVDFSPYQNRDSSLTGKRYTASGVWNPTTADDGDYSNLRFSSKIGRRLRNTTQAWALDAPDGSGTVVEVFRIAANGQWVPNTTGGGYVLPSYTTAELSNIAHAVNTTGKFLNKIVINSTTGIVMRANSAAAGGTWRDFMNGSTITPV